MDAADFVLTTGSYLTGVRVTGLTGTRTSYIVTVNTGIGGGSLRLDVTCPPRADDRRPGGQPAQPPAVRSGRRPYHPVRDCTSPGSARCPD